MHDLCHFIVHVQLLSNVFCMDYKHVISTYSIILKLCVLKVQSIDMEWLSFQVLTIENRNYYTRR